jgi:hypothetical protein
LFGQSFSATRLNKGMETIAMANGMIMADTTSDSRIPVFGFRP